MKFLVIGDLHGAMPCIPSEKFDAIIAPGDFCSDEAKGFMFQALKERLADPKKDTQWYDIAGRKNARAIIKRSLADGRRVLEFLNSQGVPVYVVPGNWDWTGKEFGPEVKGWPFAEQDHYATLIRGLDDVVDSYHKAVSIGGLTIIGHGIIPGPEFPQYTEDVARYSPAGLKRRKKWYDAERKKVAALFKKAKRPVVFITHNVPYNTPLDKINNPASPRNGQHFGSVIAREMVDSYSPLLCIGGHMHEYFGYCKLGRTTCVNAGFGGAVYTIIETNGSAIQRMDFYRDGKRIADSLLE
ncbi:TPA: hypothetical protein HA251_00065 [Candidatus Woesearchaeota archaeon]|nr:hypothetical protein [Candidatus Woesearchaeota archaeon]